MTENEELLMLRALAEKQKAELAAKDKTIEGQKVLIEDQKAQIEKQRIQIDNMLQALQHARKRLFGPSSEVTSQAGEQMNLFENSLELAKELFKEQKKITVPSHERTPRQPGVRAEMLSGLPKEIEEFIINTEETCSICGGELKLIGKKLIRTEVEFIPPKLKVKQIVQQVAKCLECGTEESENPKDHFQEAAVPNPVLPHSIATPSLVAHVMYQKFDIGIPFNRQEKGWYRMGLVLPRANMANWVIRCSEEWLMCMST